MGKKDIVACQWLFAVLNYHYPYPSWQCLLAGWEDLLIWQKIATWVAIPAKGAATTWNYLELSFELSWQQGIILNQNRIYRLSLSYTGKDWQILTHLLNQIRQDHHSKKWRYLCLQSTSDNLLILASTNLTEINKISFQIWTRKLWQVQS